MTRKRLLVASVAASAVLALGLGLSAAVAHRLTRRPHPRFAEPVPSWAVGRIEEDRLRTRDDQEVAAWFLDGRADRAAVLLLHGNGGCRLSSVRAAEFLAKAGHAVLMISLRAHGDSTGEVNDFGYSARADVVAAVDFLESRAPGRPVVVMGSSLGAAAAIFAAGELGDRMAGYVLESPYRDLETAVRNRTDVHLPPVLSGVGYLGLRLAAPLILPHFGAIAPVEHIGAIPATVPVLLLAGEADRLARPEEATALFDRVSSHARLLTFPRAGHYQLHDTDPARYEREVLEFCREATRRSG